MISNTLLISYVIIIASLTKKSYLLLLFLCFNLLYEIKENDLDLIEL